MKVLLINKFLYPNGGSETYIFQLGEYLQSQGHEVQYFGMEHENRIVGNAVNPYTSNMDFHGGSKLSKLMYPFKTVYSLEARKAIRRVLEDFQPDVCHLNNFNFQLTPSIILEIVKWREKRKKPCRIIYTAHDYQLICPNHMCHNMGTHENCEKCLGGRYIHCVKGKCIHSSGARSAVGSVEGYYWKMRHVYRYIDATVCCSHFIKQKLDTNPDLVGKTVVLHNFVSDVVRKSTEKKDYVLYFGRFSLEKGVRTLVQVAKELPEIPFVFAGSGPLEDELSGISNIQNVGFQRGEHLERLIREARFAVCPSEWYENCPFSVMESQMLGTPVIGADIGGIPELLENGKTGLLFESGNASQLKECIRNLWFDREILHQYSTNCQNVSFVTMETYYESLLNIYSSNN